VISEVYGGGGNSGSTYENDFIELQNRGPGAVSVSGWSVQYHSSSASTTSWQVTDLSGSIPAGGVYLVSEASGGGGTKPLPAAQASGSVNLSATAGTVALVNSALSLASSSTATVVAGSVNLAGYGSTAIFEDSPAPAPASTTSDQRRAAADTSDNATDFATGTPTPGTTPGGTGTTGTTPTLITEPSQGLQPLDNYIESATSSIDMTMYALQDTSMETLLGDEAGKGITVRVVLDASSNEKTNNTPAFNYLSAHGVQVVWSNPSFTFTHEKSIIVDDSSIAIMSLNLQAQFYSTSRDFAVLDDNASDVTAAEAVFNADFNHQSITPSDGANLVSSPTDSQTQLLALINGASSSLVVENEEMGDAAVVSALGSAAARGVNVEVAMTDSGTYHSEFNTLTQDGVHIATYSPSASLYIHAKVIIADNTRAFVGSENFSNTSLNDNRELGLITTDSTILSSLESPLASDFAGGTPYSG
jgi:phosphatidylserine/phosphatidylglycerophosphate/cardiolipin synthase-like enzyme